MTTNMLSVAMWLSCGCWWSMVAMISCAPGEPNARCCYDQEYSVILADIGAGVDGTTGESYVDDGFVRLSKDYYRSRYGTRISQRQPDGSLSSTYELRDYAQRLVYTVKDNGTCVVTDMPSFEKMHESCIPEMAVYLGPSILGYGTNSLRVNTWQFPFPVTGNVTGQFTMTVTHDHCVPMTETMVAHIDGNPMEQTLFFVKYHPGIVDLNFLVPPADCQRLSTSHSPPFFGHGFFGAV